MIHPLEDLTYVPVHQPVDGVVPAVVEKWGPRSQLRWFNRFFRALALASHEFWDRYFCASEQHRGMCCSSCMEDQMDGYGPYEDYCCCRSLR